MQIQHSKQEHTFLNCFTNFLNCSAEDILLMPTPGDGHVGPNTFAPPDPVTDFFRLVMVFFSARIHSFISQFHVCIL